MKNLLRKFWSSLLVVILLGLVPGGWTLHAQSRGKLLKQADKEMRQARFAAAEEIYNKLLERDQADKQARLGISFAQIRQNKLQPGYENAAQVVAADPLDARGHTLLGTALLRAGEFRTSIESLYTAVKLNDKEALAIAGLSDVEYFENRPRNAYAGLRRAVQLDPNEPDYYISLARVCSRLEYYNESADAFQKYLEISPNADAERRARIKGLIDFYRYLGTTRIHRTTGSELSSIPFELINFRPMISVMVNGKGPLHFVIDTGASLTVLSEQAAQRLGVKSVAKGGNARAIGGSGAFPIVYGLLENLTIGEARIETIPIYIRTVYSSPETPEHERVDGYIGLSMLANYAISLDYKARQMTLDRTPLPPLTEPSPQMVTGSVPRKAGEARESGEGVRVGAPAEIVDPFRDLVSRTTSLKSSPGLHVSEDGYEVPIRSTSGGLASTEANLPGVDRPLNFIIDTGASVSVVSKLAVTRYRLEPLILPDLKFRVIGAAGISEGAEALGLSTLSVNGLRKKASRALILDLASVNETSGFEQHGVLGGDYLSHFKVVFDLRRYLFRLTPQTTSITIVTGQGQPEEKK